MTPRCYNRQPLKPGYWARDGYRKGKPHYRWIPHRMSTGCQSRAEVEYLGGNCEGCRWTT